MAWALTILKLIRGSIFAQVLAVALAGLVALKLYGYQKKQEGKQELRVESQKAGEVAGKKSEQEHAKAEKPGAAERLLRNSCRDCK